MDHGNEAEMLPYHKGDEAQEILRKRAGTHGDEAPLFQDVDAIEAEVREDVGAIPPSQPPGAPLKTP